jgi:hypothetical protein
MSLPGKDPLFQVPGINRTGPQHIAAVIRFNDHRIAAAKFFPDRFRYVPEIHQSRHFYSVILCNKTEIVRRIVGNAKGFKIYVTDAKLSARFNINRAVF